MNIYLIGFMGTGKTSVSKELKKRLPKYTEYDMDSLIEKREGTSINTIFAEKGEAYFRDVETDVLWEISKEDESIISCGGGTVLKKENRDIIKSGGRAVLLTARPETVLSRLENDESRPLLKNKHDLTSIRKLMDDRDESYKAAADIVISTDEKTTKKIADEIMAEFFR